MKMNLQEKKMKRIAELLSGNLSYIAGENENGVNGEKAEFLRTSAAFLRKLGKDLGFTESRVHTNPAGIAVSGSVLLYGMWGDGNGICFVLDQRQCCYIGKLTALMTTTAGRTNICPFPISRKQIMPDCAGIS